MRNLVITENAIVAARNAGLYGDTGKRLARMAKRAAPFTHELGNRRFNDFILRIVDGKLLDVTRLEPSYS